MDINKTFNSEYWHCPRQILCEGKSALYRGAIYLSAGCFDVTTTFSFSSHTFEYSPHHISSPQPFLRVLSLHLQAYTVDQPQRKLTSGLPFTQAAISST